MEVYLALYRKWRPQTFSDVRGQEHITEILKRQSADGRISHAYLFCGSRGTGKTSTAKILAKAANCLDLRGGDPCNECANCRAIDAGTAPDVLEIDAASNNSVDDIRDLRDEVVYPPAILKKRVYIIDEVHMLSASAFNALLKTLEEPPEHVIFILATTELASIPATILSRCLRFEFNRIPAEVIRDRIAQVAAAEGIKLSDDAASLLARLADGALRDALSLLEACAAAAEGRGIEVETVRAQLGISGGEAVTALLCALLEKDLPKALEVTDEVHRSAKNIPLFIEDVLEALRALLIRKSRGAGAEEEDFPLSVSADDRERLYELCDKSTAAELMRNALAFEEFLGKTGRNGVNRRTLLSLTVIRLCRPELAYDPASLDARITELERKISLLSAGMSPAPAAETGEAAASKAPKGPGKAADIPAAKSGKAALNTGAGAEVKGGPESTEKSADEDGERPVVFEQTAELLEALKGHKNLFSFLSLSRIVRTGEKLTVYTDYLGRTMISTDGAKKLIVDAAKAVTGKSFELEITEKAPEKEHPSLIFEIQEAADEGQIT